MEGTPDKSRKGNGKGPSPVSLWEATWRRGGGKSGGGWRRGLEASVRNPAADGTSPRGEIYPLETQQQPEERRTLSQGGGEMAGPGAGTLWHWWGWAFTALRS